MTGTLAETLLPAIEQLTEAVRDIDATVATSFWDIWGPSFLTFVGTLVFACIAIRSLKAAKEANELTIHLNFKNRLLDDFQAISEFSSKVKELLLKKDHGNKHFDEIEKTFSLLATKLTERYYFFVFFPLSYEYLHTYSLHILSKSQTDSNWTQPSQNDADMIYRPHGFIKQLEEMFHDIARLSRNEPNKRIELETQSIRNFVQSDCPNFNRQEKFEILAKATDSLRIFELYDFS